MELCGRPLNVGRPKGYQELAAKGQLPAPPTASMPLRSNPMVPSLLPNLLPAVAAAVAQSASKASYGGPGATAGGTCCVLMENLVPVCALYDDKEYKDVSCGCSCSCSSV